MVEFVYVYADFTAFYFLFLKLASCCIYTRIINIYKFYRQRNNCLLTYIALHVSTLSGHPQVLQISHGPLGSKHVVLYMLINNCCVDGRIYIC
jgi:hypothetical protein